MLHHICKDPFLNKLAFVPGSRTSYLQEAMFDFTLTIKFRGKQSNLFSLEKEQGMIAKEKLTTYGK